jgi:hypothetical protein
MTDQAEPIHPRPRLLAQDIIRHADWLATERGYPLNVTVSAMLTAAVNIMARETSREAAVACLLEQFEKLRQEPD